MAATRKCTRCRDANGVPTGRVRGGECFLCHGNGNYTVVTVDAATREAGARRVAAINALRAADAPTKARNAREHLEEVAPARHSKLIDSVLAGRVADVITSLLAYAVTEGL